MKRVRRRRAFEIFAISTGFVIAVLAACSNQGEGERCQILNGNDDCQDGLVCTQITGQNGERCCPPDRAQATTPVCQQQIQTPNADAQPPADTGPAPDVVVGDAPSETGTDASDASDAADAADAEDSG